MTQEKPKTEDVLLKIKSRGYWEVILRPTEYNPSLISSLSECTKLVDSSKVILRGWDYPHKSIHGITSGSDYVESLTDWEPYIELWRMYQSGQFYHLFAFHEDWWGPIRIFGSNVQYLESGYGLEFLSTLYTITEICEFTKRLVKNDVFKNEINLKINLNNVKNRVLVTTQFGRHILPDHECVINNIPIEKRYNIEEILSNSGNIALDITNHIYERFNWLNVPKTVLKEEQDKFLKGIYA
jgi:hypothetical protein